MEVAIEYAALLIGAVFLALVVLFSIGFFSRGNGRIRTTVSFPALMTATTMVIVMAAMAMAAAMVISAGR